MSTEWFDVARKMLLRECTKINTIITTALILGKNIPLLITKEIVYTMLSGSFTIDLAAESDGNIETTIAEQTVKVTSKDGLKIICVGYILTRQTGWQVLQANFTEEM